ncbi:monovalent cation/H+ antiporter subunit D family protein [Halovenus marina]|uniref:monovalent cation/H+ antiporter subunit D family protein n=1 Tax=Halovenus marina TaxID=3396621 RepID=UPI003F577B32
MTDTLLALLIVVPILAATLPLALGLLREDVGWSIAAVALSLEAVLASVVAYTIYVDGERIVHVLGGSEFGRYSVEFGGTTSEFIVGIELVGDALSGLLVVLIAAVSLAVLAFSRTRGPRGNAFYSGYLMLTGGLMGVPLTGDLFNMFVFLEIVGLTTYALVASSDHPEAAVAALKYLIIGTTGASLYLIGVGYLYVRTGTLNMVDVSRSLAGEPGWIDGALYGDPLVVAGFGFIAVGLATKAAIFPLHTWQPGAYSEAPDAVTVHISALVSTVSAYAFARVTWFVFTPDFFAVNPIAIEAVLLLAAISIIAGSVLAATQRRVKRMFAYSSVAQFGLVILSVGVAVHPAAGPQATRFAVYGAGIHLIGHAVIKGGLFATVGSLAAATDARRVSDYAGLAKRRPFLSGALAVLGLALVGVPPTVGLLGKWYIALGAVQSEIWPLVAVVFVSTVLSLLYVARLIEKLYFDPGQTTADSPDSETVATDGSGQDETMNDTDDTDATERQVPVGMVAVALIAAALAVALGFAGADLATALDPVADAVVESAPEVSS